MNNPVTLLIELSLPSGRVSIRDKENLCAVREVDGDVSGSAGALESIDELLRQNDVSMRDIHEAICTKGPGGYTGIRVALSIVSGLKRSLGIKAHAYPLFDVLLQDPVKRKTAVAIDAGRNEMLVSVAGQSMKWPEFVRCGEMGIWLGENGIEELILSSKFEHEFLKSFGEDVSVSNASDNITDRLFEFHNSESASAVDGLDPIYGREFIRR